MEIMYLDNKLAVCLKPPGVLSTDEPGGLPSLLREALGDPAAPVYTVHRLDAAAGGLMVLARTRQAARTLGAAMEAGAFEKEYLAVARGAMAEPSGTLRDWLRRDTRERKTFVVTQPGRDVREAVLDYRVLGEREGLSLLRIRLHTGRTHQIRCQFAHRGCPLWGDRKYAPGEETGPLALWSARLAFPHPVTGETLSFAHRPPAGAPWTEFEELL